MIIAACCDVTVCGESSRFGVPVNRLGATMAYEEMAPLVNRWHKKFVRRMAEGGTLSEAERAEAYEAFRTRDYREGTAAFVQKRPPRFSGE